MSKLFCILTPNMSALAGCEQGDEQNVFHFTKGHNKLPDGKLDVEFEPPHNTAAFVDVFSPVMHRTHTHSRPKTRARTRTHFCKIWGEKEVFSSCPICFYVLCNEMKVRATYVVSVLAELPRRGRQGTSSFHSHRQPHVHAQQALPQDGSKSTALSFSNPSK